MNTQLSHGEEQARSASQRFGTPPHSSRRRQIIIVLSACMALQMTSFVIILPLFARRFDELGAGVEALGMSAMAYALAAMLAAPFMGTLADRFGRRQLVLASLAVYALAFTGYRFASSASAFILLRGLAGAFTAGLIPAVTGIVADLAPTDRRAQWIGIVNGGASIGWIAGPVLGGMLYDRWGYGFALNVSILLAVLTFTVALLLVPETRLDPRHPAAGIKSRPARRFLDGRSSLGAFRDTLPDSLSSFIVLLFVAFAVMFAWAFMEPKFMFYVYDDLGWSSSMLGLVMSTYGIAMTVGEFGLSPLSDRFGRRRIIALGIVLFSTQFIGLALTRNYILIAVSFVIAGLGNSLFDPALNASIMDIAPTQHRARILGFKSTANSLGNIVGPGMVVLFTSWMSATGIFLISVLIVALCLVLFLFFQTKPRSIHLEPDALTNERPIHQ